MNFAFEKAKQDNRNIYRLKTGVLTLIILNFCL